MTTKKSPKNKHDKEKVKLYDKKPRRWQRENEEIEQLKQLYDQIEPSAIETFKDIPLSENTRKGLKDGKFKTPTEIQREAILLALRGSDVLGAAKTGSGKTLAFLIPILEILYTKKWSAVDGLGALIITPTRELAYQIFEVLRIVGSHHEFSAGLIIGGKDLKFERKRMDKCNIMICTPGRLLQHMDETAIFSCSNLQMLVLDEADRILDLGFQATMNSIIENLPPERQTLLFSATQTKSVKDLARLSLSHPMYVSVHEHSEASTPKGLEQSYIVAQLEDKVNLLWSFIKGHKKSKILVFMSSCKQVKYMYEAFCRMQPGISILALYGTMHQMRRMSVYDQFVKKTHAILFATDIAARGLDFPMINWVVQLDCPEDAKTYIHRAGRTARYEKGGESLLVLMPSEEEAMVKELLSKKIPIQKIRVNPKKSFCIKKSLESKCARDVNLKDSAKRAFVSYLKSIFLMKNKQVFDVTKLNTDAYSASLGLAVPPRIRFLQKYLKQNKLKEKAVHEDGSDGDENASDSEQDKNAKLEFSGLNESDDDLFTVKQVHFTNQPTTKEDVQPIESRHHKAVTKAAVVKKILKKNIKSNIKIRYNENGEIIEDSRQVQKTVEENDEDSEDEIGGINIAKSKAIMEKEDKFDKQLYKQKIKQMHKEKKKKVRVQKKQAEDEAEDMQADRGSSDDDGGVELSFLPDPDKIYGKQTEEESEDDDADIPVEDSFETSQEIPKKRKLKDEGKDSKKKKKKKQEDTSEVLDTGLNLEEDEELALHLLNAT